MASIFFEKKALETRDDEVLVSLPRRKNSIVTQITDGF